MLAHSKPCCKSGSCQTCIAKYTGSPTEIEFGGVTYASIPGGMSAVSQLAAALPDGYVVTDCPLSEAGLSTGTTPSGFTSATIIGYDLLTTPDPLLQYDWPLTAGTFEGAYDGNWSASVNSGFTSNNWDQSIHNNAGNGIRYYLDGVASGVTHFAISNDYNFGSNTQNDGISEAVILLYDASGAEIAQAPISLANQNATQEIDIGGPYDRVAYFDILIIDVFDRAPIQWREVSLAGASLTMARPDAACSTTVYSYDQPGSIVFDGEAVDFSCADGVSIPSSCPEFSFRFESGSCQSVIVDTIQATEPVTVVIDGVTVNDFPYRLDDLPAAADIGITVTDGNGCTVGKRAVNTQSFARQLWSSSQQFAARTISVGESFDYLLDSGSNIHIDGSSSTSGGTSYVAQVTTAESVIFRYGDSANKNVLILNDAGNVPISIDNFLCTSGIAWSIELYENQVMSAQASVLTYVRFYDSSGSLIESRLVDNTVDDYTRKTISGVEALPSGAESVDIYMEFDSQGENRFHRVDFSNGLTFLDQT